MTTPGPWSEARARCEQRYPTDADYFFGLVDLVAALDAIDAVLALHADNGRGFCSHCGDASPCPTARALGVTE